jgi:hypothetical protein
VRRQTARAGTVRGLMRGILLLRRVESNGNSFLLFVDFEILAEGLVTFRDHLYADFALRDGGDAGFAFLVGAQFEGGADVLTEFDDRAALNETDDDAGAVDGAARLALDLDIEAGHGRVRKQSGGYQQECGHK